MNIFGVEVNFPSLKELMLATFSIIALLAFSLILGAMNGGSIGHFLPGLAAVSTGILSATFGVSPSKGWRACVFLLVIGSFVFLLVNIFS